MTLHAVCSEYPKYMPHEWLRMLREDDGALADLSFDADVLVAARLWERKQFDSAKDAAPGRPKETDDEAKQRRKAAWRAFVKSIPEEHPVKERAMKSIPKGDR